MKSRSSCMAYGALGGVVTLLVVAFVSAQYSDYNSRARTSSMLDQLKVIQKYLEPKLVGRYLLEDPESTISEISARVPAGNFGFFRILADGTVLARGAKDGQMIVLIPEQVGGAIEWQCIGGSSKDMVLQCR